MITHQGNDEGFFRWDKSEALVSYPNETMLRIKQEIHEAHRLNDRTIADHIVDCLASSPGDSLLDIGCGNAWLLTEVLRREPSIASAVGIDISEGVLADAQGRVERARLGDRVQLEPGDVDSLQFVPPRRFERVMANYMLHYARDIYSSLKAIHQLLTPSGRFVCATDSIETMPELYAIHYEVAQRCALPPRLVMGTPKVRLSLDNGPDLLGQVFRRVDFAPFEDALSFTEAHQAVRFYADGNNFMGARTAARDTVPAEVFSDMRSLAHQAIQREIDIHGRFTITKRTGCLVAYP